MRIRILAARLGPRGSTRSILCGRNHLPRNIPSKPFTDADPSSRLTYNLKNGTLEFFRGILFSIKCTRFEQKKMVEALFFKSDILSYRQSLFDKCLKYEAVIDFHKWSKKHYPTNFIQQIQNYNSEFNSNYDTLLYVIN